MANIAHTTWTTRPQSLQKYNKHVSQITRQKSHMVSVSKIKAKGLSQDKGIIFMAASGMIYPHAPRMKQNRHTNSLQNKCRKINGNKGRMEHDCVHVV